MANDTLPVVSSGGKTPEMVERVARAICQHDEQAGAPAWGWYGATNSKNPYYDFARAAIAAMREPTTPQLTAGEYMDDLIFHADPPGAVLRMYHAMIDAALSE